MFGDVFAGQPMQLLELRRFVQQRLRPLHDLTHGKYDAGLRVFADRLDPRELAIPPRGKGRNGGRAREQTTQEGRHKRQPGREQQQHSRTRGVTCLQLGRDRLDLPAQFAVRHRFFDIGSIPTRERNLIGLGICELEQMVDETRDRRQPPSE